MGINWRAVAIVALVLATWPANWQAMRGEWGFYDNDPAHEWSAPEWGYDEGTRGPAIGARAWALIASPITFPAVLVVEAAKRTAGDQGAPTPAAGPDPRPAPGLWIVPIDPPGRAPLDPDRDWPPLDEAPRWEPPPLDPEDYPGPLDPGGGRAT